MSSEERSVTKKTRGKAAPDRQLSGLQRRILIWIFRQQSTIEMFGRIGDDIGVAGKGVPPGRTFNEYVKELRQKGIPWSAKRFYDAVPTKLESKSLSRALLALEERGLLIRYDITGGLGLKSRAEYARLTKSGRDVACSLIRSDGKSEREVKEQSTPAERLIRKRLHYLKGRLKMEKAHLKILEEKKAWEEEFGGREGTCWDKTVNPEVWIKIVEADLSEARREIETTEAQIETMETFRDYEALDRLMENPRLMLPGVPWQVYKVLLKRELAGDLSPSMLTT